MGYSEKILDNESRPEIRFYLNNITNSEIAQILVNQQNIRSKAYATNPMTKLHIWYDRFHSEEKNKELLTSASVCPLPESHCSI